MGQMMRKNAGRMIASALVLFVSAVCVQRVLATTEKTSAFDPFNPQLESTTPADAGVALDSRLSTRPPVRDPFRPPVRSPFRP